MITIPTVELVGLLSDVIPMAGKDTDELDLNCVRLSWDGEKLHAQATNRHITGWSTWDPDDSPAQDHQGDLLNQWGGTDAPWAATIALADATHLVKTYKLGGKRWFVPLTIECTDAGVRIVRSKDHGHSVISTVVKDRFVEFPRVDELLAETNVAGKTANASALSFNPKHLAAFGKVREHGDGKVDLRFTGPAGLVHVYIGTRFRGGIQPVYSERFKDDAKPRKAKS